MPLAPLNPEQHNALRMIKSAPTDIQAALDRQRDMVQRGEFALDLVMHGKLEIVYFSRPLERGQKIRKGVMEAALDFNSQGPRVAFSRDHNDLLVLDRAGHELPPLPAVNEKGETIRDLKGEIVYAAKCWEDYRPVILEGRDRGLLVFRDVKQIVFIAPGGRYGSVKCNMGAFDDFTALLVDPETGAMNFLGGRLEFSLG